MKKPSFDTLKKLFSWKRIMAFWYRHYKIMFFGGFVAVFFMAGYLWYTNLYRYHWSAEQKKAFIDTHYRATAFKEKAFDQLVSALKDRALRHQKSFPLTRDIFSGKSL